MNRRDAEDAENIARSGKTLKCAGFGKGTTSVKIIHLTKVGQGVKVDP